MMFSFKLFLVLCLVKSIFPKNVSFYNQFFEIENNVKENVCVKYPCIQLCVDPPTDHSNLTITIHNQTREMSIEKMFYFYEKNLCDPLITLEETFYIQSNGDLYIENFDGADTTWKSKKYCVSFSKNITNIVLCANVVQQDEDDVNTSNIAGMIISMPFLLITLAVYVLIPERNLHMNALLFYVFCLLMAYIFLLLVQKGTSLISEEQDKICLALALLTHFFFMASFLWMNVICVDFWITFSGYRGFQGSKRTAERKRLYVYSGYVWGLTILQTLTLYLINTYGNSENWYHPGINNGRCWFEHHYDELLYFQGPMAFIICINTVLFSLTMYKIRQSQNETKMLRKGDSNVHSNEKDTQKFYLFLKLFLAMGVNWTMEFISWLIEWHFPDIGYLFYITDFGNAIYGLIIFVLFVCKKKIWKLLQKRYNSITGKSVFSRGISGTQTFRLSATESTTIEDPKKSTQ